MPDPRDFLPAPPSNEEVSTGAKLPYYLFHLALARITNPPAFRGAMARIHNLERRLGRPLQPHELASVLEKWLSEEV